MQNFGQNNEKIVALAVGKDGKVVGKVTTK